MAGRPVAALRGASLTVTARPPGADDIDRPNESETLTLTGKLPSSAYVLLPVTANVPFPWEVNVAAEVWPSPQSIVPVKLAAVRLVFGSVRIATAPLNAVPSLTWAVLAVGAMV